MWFFTLKSFYTLRITLVQLLHLTEHLSPQIANWTKQQACGTLHCINCEVLNHSYLPVPLSSHHMGTKVVRKGQLTVKSLYIKCRWSSMAVDSTEWIWLYWTPDRPAPTLSHGEAVDSVDPVILYKRFLGSESRVFRIPDREGSEHRSVGCRVSSSTWRIRAESEEVFVWGQRFRDSEEAARWKTLKSQSEIYSWLSCFSDCADLNK